MKSVSAAIFVISVFSAICLAACAVSLSPAREQPEAGRGLFSCMNALREEAGVPALEWSDEAYAVASAKVRDMSANGYFAHASPVYGALPSQFTAWGGITPARVGENIALIRGISPSPGVIADAWENSPPHIAAIHDAGFTHAGAAVLVCGGRVYAAAEFLCY